MKTRNLITISFLIAFIFTINTLQAKWYVDHDFKFKIDVPANWSSNSYMDGTDKIYDFYSPDENIAIQVRAFQAGAGVTTDVLAQVYEENMLPAGTQKQSLDEHTSKNGIPGKLGIYTAKYNGIDITMSAFYTVQNGFGYAVTVIVPTSMLQQKSPEIKSVTQSFIIEGFEPQEEITQQEEKKPSGLSGLLGGTKSNDDQTAVPADITGRYNFISRSDGKNMVNYHYIDIRSNGTYSEKYQPKNSPNYQGGNDGTWKVNGNTLTLTHKGGGITDTYTIRGSELIRTSDSGITFTFRK